MGTSWFPDSAFFFLGVFFPILILNSSHLSLILEVRELTIGFVNRLERTQKC